jgi:hypothetical protein
MVAETVAAIRAVAATAAIRANQGRRERRRRKDLQKNRSVLSPDRFLIVF